MQGPRRFSPPFLLLLNKYYFVELMNKIYYVDVTNYFIFETKYLEPYWYLRIPNLVLKLNVLNIWSWRIPNLLLKNCMVYIKRE